MLFAGGMAPAFAARPLLDSGKWDNYFALFARGAAVPWKRVSLRLDTFSGAPVDFAAYDVDPADVLVAGANARPRAIDTAHRTAVAKWRFTPPAGLKFESNDVEVPLQNREGFYVIEARRGDAVQQVWINLSRIGLVTKESPAGSLVYAADLRTGRAFSGMRIGYLVGTQLHFAKTDVHGISRVPAHARFALADWGRSHTFVSFLPQSPPPTTVVGVRAERASVQAGDTMRAIGFVRRRNGDVYRPATGDVAVTLFGSGKTLASAHATLDRAGAFAVDLAIPANTAAGDDAILASAAGASGGATIRVDGIGDVALSVSAPCANACPADAAIPLTLTARRGSATAAGVDVRVRVVRSPHVLVAAEGSDDAPAWGTTMITDSTVRTDAQGVAHVSIPAPSDGLASTYGVSASSGASTATTSLVAPTARLALAITPVQSSLDVGEPASVVVRGFDALAGTPSSGTSVLVKIVHGPTEQQQTVTLGSDGTARATFRDVALGMNLVSAEATVDGRRAYDVSAVTVAPRALGAEGGVADSGIRLTLDRPRHRPGERVTVNASLPNARGDALFTIESARGVVSNVVPAPAGSASTTLTIPDTIGATTIGVAFVRDGAIVSSGIPVPVDGPGHQRALTMTGDRETYAPGSTAKVSIAGGNDTAESTLAVRITDRRAGSGASFEDMASVLASSMTTTQNTASADPPWHTWVAPAKSTAGDIFGFDRPRTAPQRDDQITGAGENVFAWQVTRGVRGGSFDVTVPRAPGRYVLGIVKITDDGEVGSATMALTVQ